MKKQYILLVSLVCIILSASVAQTTTAFRKNYDQALFDLPGNIVEGLTPETYVMAGTNLTFLPIYGTVTELNDTGAINWSFRYSDASIGFQLNDIKKDVGSNQYITCGGSETNDAVFMILDATGNVVVSKKFIINEADGAWFNRVIKASDGGYVAVGYVTGHDPDGAGPETYFAPINYVDNNGDPQTEYIGSPLIVKLDASGNHVWHRVFRYYTAPTTAPAERIYNDASFVDVVEVSDGYVAVGSYDVNQHLSATDSDGNDATPTDAIILKTSVAGAITYHKQIDTPDTDPSQNSKYLAAVNTTSTGDLIMGGMDNTKELIQKYVGPGGFSNIFSRRFTYPGFLSVTDVSQIYEVNGGTDIATMSMYIQPTAFVFSNAIHRFNSTATSTVFAKRYDFNLISILPRGNKTSDNGYISMSMTAGGANYDYHVIKTDPNGDTPAIGCPPVAFTPTADAGPTTSGDPSFVSWVGTPGPNTLTIVRQAITPTPSYVCTKTACTPPLAATTVTATPNPICAGASTTITASGPSSNVSYNVYTASTGGTNLGSTPLSVSPASTTTYYIETVSNSDPSCVSTTRTSITVTVNPTTSSTDVQTACDSYTWPLNGTTYNASTSTPTVTLTNAAGCDSVVTLNLTINNSNTGTDVQNACDSYTWPLNGTTYNASTSTPTVTLTNAAGCDSVVTLNLTINSSNTGTDVQTACDSYTWPLNGTTYNASTSTPTVTLTNAVGCDSIVTLNLTINSSNTGTDVQTACDSYTWPLNGTTYNASTSTPTVTLTNAAGCDSVVTLNLTINSSNTGTDVQTACDSYTWPLNGTTYTASTSTPTVTLTNAAGCDSVVTLNLTINNSNTGTDIQTACDSLTWIDGITYTSSTTTPTFTIVGGTTNGCDSTVTLNLTINPSLSAGTFGSTTLCPTDPATDLFNQLGGTPDAGGSWTGPSGLAGGDQGTFDPATNSAGTYTYTVTNGCGTDTASVNVTINPSPNTGSNGTAIMCAGASAVNLLDSLGGTPDAGGSWSGPSGLTGGDQGTFDPATNTAGTYTYTVTNSCGSSNNDVVVTINPAPSAGTFGSTTLCPTDPATDLFNQLGGSPDNGGTWTGPSALANGDLGTFDPATNTAGTYLYTVTNSCGTDTASVTVTISTNPVPGTNGTASLCSNASSVNLLDSLGGTPSSGGSWSGPSGLTGGDLGTFDPATNTAGTYTYTVNDCSGSPQTADVVVTINPAPSAGTFGSTTLCPTDPATDLFNQLSGSPDNGGTWTGPSALANGDQGTFDPATNTAGTYLYTVTNSCGTDTASVTVTISTNPVPGTNGTASLCSNASSVNLLDSLGGTPSSGGSWSGPSGLTGGDLGTFDPATNTAGTYTYTVNDCSGSPQTADVIVTITPGPDAGTNGSITLCNTDPATDLFNQLGGTPDAGGSWSPAMNSGTGVFDPAIDAAGTYTYTVTNSCGSISADVIVTVTTCTTPTASYTVSDSAVCAGECITYTDASSGATSWQWTFNGGNPSSATGAGPHTVCYGTDGTYNVELIVSNSNGSDTTSSTVTIHPTPTVNAGDDVTIDLGESTVLDATGTNGTYSWTPPTDLSCNPCPNPTASPSETVTYTVIVVDSNGCTASDDVTVIVDFDYVIWVPNIFSPNGDGNNDVVYVRGVGVADLKFFIYDRWGEKVFETTDLDIGWDGTFRGSKMNNAVFVYYLEATFLDGTAVTKKGDITLVR